LLNALFYLPNGYATGLSLKQDTPFIDFYFNNSSGIFNQRIVSITATALQLIPGEFYLGANLALSRAGVSYAANGYLKLNDGFTLQWGVYTASDNTNQNITFPVTFNTCFGVVTSSSGKHFENSAVLGWNNSYFTSWSYFSETRFFIAIGI